MSSGHKRHLSPLATSGPSRKKAPRPNGRAVRVASTECQPQTASFQRALGEESSPPFPFGDVRATSSFTFYSQRPRSFNKAVSPTVVPDAPDTASLAPPSGGDSPSRTENSGAYPSNDTFSDEEPMSCPTAVATPVLSNSPTPEFRPIAKKPIEESAAVDNPTECPMDLDLISPSGPTPRGSSPTAGEIYEGRSDISYASYGTQYPTDRSIGLLSSDNPGTNETTPRNRRSPYVAISSREHSFYQACRRGSDGALTGLLDAVDALQRLRNSSERSLPTGQGVQVPDRPADMENQVPHSSADTQNEATDPVTSGGSSSNTPIVQGVDDPRGAQRPLNNTADRCSHRILRKANDAPSDARGPHLSRDSHSCADTGNAATGTPVHPVDNTTAPINYEGAVPPPVDMEAPPAPPLHRIRARGIFIIGNGAPIRIDEGIEVHLRDGIDGQVDFVI